MSRLNSHIRAELRYTLIVLCLTLLLASGSITSHPAQTNPTPSIPKLTDDGMRTLVGLNGKRARPLMVYLWYTDCQPCDDRLPDVGKIYQEFKGKGLDVALVAIEPMDGTEKLSKYLTDHKIQTPTYLLNSFEDDLSNDVFLKDWEAIVPSVFFYDKTGHIVFSETAETHIDYAQLKPRISKALAATK